MVNKSNKDLPQDDVEITSENMEMTEPELEEVEVKNDTFNNTLRDKLKTCESEKRSLLEDAQRTKADFLNARRRLEEERSRDKERSTIEHIEALIPLCDSFQVAMSDKEVWEKTDENWRKGIEGIHSQLQSILNSHKIVALNPVGEEFNPHEHEAISSIPVETEKDNHKIISVIQTGYVMKKEGTSTVIIRPARVIIGERKEN